MIRNLISRRTSRSKIRLVKQSEVAECGLACFVMVANFHHRDIGLPSARKVASSSARGSSLKALSILAHHFGFDSRGIQVSGRSLDEVALPAILHWEGNHFVVAEVVRDGRALIHDPNGFSRWVGLGDITHHFTGFAFEMKPKRRYKPTTEVNSTRLSYLRRHVRRNLPKIAQALSLTLFLQAAALLTPYFSQISIDKALPSRDEEFLSNISLLFIAFIFFNGFIHLLRLNIISIIGASLGEGISSDVSKKLFRLPIQWFKKRESGEILSKFHAIFPIKHVLSDDIPSLLVNAVLSSLTFVMMAIYSPVLALIGLAALLAYAAVRSIFLPRQKAALSEMVQAEGEEHAFLIGSLHCIRSLRLSCRETDRQEAFHSMFARFIQAELRYKRLSNRQKSFQTTLLAFVSVAIIWISVTMAMRGQFTQGMIFAYLSYHMQFMMAGIEVIDKYSNIRELDSYVNHISDITETDDDIAFTSEDIAETTLSGKIELNHISYRYAKDAPDVLEDINLAIQPGESVAIAGPSGGGKSTLAQILLGLNRPTSGSILVDGIDLEAFGYRNYYRQVAAVLQDEGLFSGSILDNITLFSQSADMQLVEECIKAAAIDEEISSWPLGLGTLVGDMGIAVSSGQRQRILLARALYCRPKILVLDEGTAHLDSRCEKRVNEAIRKLGITRIIFAHRRETIESADRILILQGGRISDVENERGLFEIEASSSRG